MATTNNSSVYMSGNNNDANERRSTPTNDNPVSRLVASVRNSNSNVTDGTGTSSPSSSSPRRRHVVRQQQQQQHARTLFVHPAQQQRGADGRIQQRLRFRIPPGARISFFPPNHATTANSNSNDDSNDNATDITNDTGNNATNGNNNNNNNNNESENQNPGNNNNPNIALAAALAHSLRMNPQFVFPVGGVVQQQHQQQQPIPPPAVLDSRLNVPVSELVPHVLPESQQMLKKSSVPGKLPTTIVPTTTTTTTTTGTTKEKETPEHSNIESESESQLLMEQQQYQQQREEEEGRDNYDSSQLYVDTAEQNQQHHHEQQQQEEERECFQPVSEHDDPNETNEEESNVATASSSAFEMLQQPQEQQQPDRAEAEAQVVVVVTPSSSSSSSHTSANLDSNFIYQNNNNVINDNNNFDSASIRRRNSSTSLEAAVEASTEMCEDIHTEGDDKQPATTNNTRRQQQCQHQMQNRHSENGGSTPADFVATESNDSNSQSTNTNYVHNNDIDVDESSSLLNNSTASTENATGSHNVTPDQYQQNDENDTIIAVDLARQQHQDEHSDSTTVVDCTSSADQTVKTNPVLSSNALGDNSAVEIVPTDPELSNNALGGDSATEIVTTEPELNTNAVVITNATEIAPTYMVLGNNAVQHCNEVARSASPAEQQQHVNSNDAENVLVETVTSDDENEEESKQKKGSQNAQEDSRTTLFSQHSRIHPDESAPSIQSLPLPCSIHGLGHLKCSICFEYMKEPVSCGECSGRFCRACLETVAKGSISDNNNNDNNNSLAQQQQQLYNRVRPQCPTCRHQFTHNQIHYDHVLQDELMQVSVRLGPFGCRYEGCCAAIPTLLDVSAHESICPHVRVACRYAPYGCLWKGKREDVIGHELEECVLSRIPGFVEQHRTMRLQARQDIHMLQHRSGNLSAVIDGQQQQLHRLTQQHQQQHSLLHRSLQQRMTAMDMKTPYHPFHLLDFVTTVVLTTPHFLQLHTMTQQHPHLSTPTSGNYTSNKWAQFYINMKNRALLSNVLCLLPTMLLLLKVLLVGYGTQIGLLVKITSYYASTSTSSKNSLEMVIRTLSHDRYFLETLLSLTKISIISFATCFTVISVAYCMLFLDSESSGPWKAYDTKRLRFVSSLWMNPIVSLVLSGSIGAVNDFNVQWRFVLHAVSVAIAGFYYFIIQYYSTWMQAMLLWLWSCCATIFLPTVVTCITMCVTKEIHFNNNNDINNVHQEILSRRAMQSASMGRNMIPVLFGLRFGMIAALFGVVPCLDTIVTLVLLKNIFSLCILSERTKGKLVAIMHRIVSFGELPLVNIERSTSTVPTSTDTNRSLGHVKTTAASVVVTSNLVACYLVIRIVALSIHEFQRLFTNTEVRDDNVGTEDSDAVLFQIDMIYALATILTLNVLMDRFWLWSAKVGLQIYSRTVSMVGEISSRQYNHDGSQRPLGDTERFCHVSGPGLAVLGTWALTLALMAVT